MVGGLVGWYRVSGGGWAGLGALCALVGSESIWCQAGMLMPAWAVWFGLWPWVLLGRRSLAGWAVLVHPSAVLLFLRRENWSWSSALGLLVAAQWYWGKLQDSCSGISFTSAGGWALPLSHWQAEGWAVVGALWAVSRVRGGIGLRRVLHWRWECAPWGLYGGRIVMHSAGLLSVAFGRSVRRLSLSGLAGVACIVVLFCGVSWSASSGFRVHPGGWAAAFCWRIPSETDSVCRNYEGCRLSWLRGGVQAGLYGFPEGGL